MSYKAKSNRTTRFNRRVGNQVKRVQSYIDSVRETGITTKPTQIKQVPPPPLYQPNLIRRLVNKIRRVF